MLINVNHFLSFPISGAWGLPISGAWGVAAPDILGMGAPDMWGMGAPDIWGKKAPDILSMSAYLTWCRHSENINAIFVTHHIYVYNLFLKKYLMVGERCIRNCRVGVYLDIMGWRQQKKREDDAFSLIHSARASDCITARATSRATARATALHHRLAPPPCTTALHHRSRLRHQCHRPKTGAWAFACWARRRPRMLDPVIRPPSALHPTHRPPSYQAPSILPIALQPTHRPPSYPSRPTRLAALAADQRRQNSPAAAAALVGFWPGL